MTTLKHSLPALLLASSLALGSSLAQAATLANDNFTLSSGSNVGTVSNTESSGTGTYTTIQGTTGMTVAPVTGFGSGNVLSFANNTNTYYRGFDGAATLTLGSLAVNQTLSLSFNARFDGGTFAAAQNFSFGFVNNTSANSILYANVDLNSGSSEYRYRTGSFNMSDAGTAFGTSWTESATANAVNTYSFQLNVTMQTGGNYLIEYYRDGALLGSSTQASGSAWATAEAAASITGVAFRHSQTPGITTYIDNVSVTTFSAIPEPSTYALLGGLSALGIVALRRRRR